ncbi:MAG: MATE family efflux transporter [Firmicutes bacterium]|nr:MATE family efflux transporter [Bacillota bacterium]MBQ1715180.1 MATE family efflux transporter [Bacillota bacterium]
MGNKSITRMTEGSISKNIIFFAIPLFWGALFQQLYNASDALIVGNFLGNEALAAVSSSGSLIFLMVGFFNGIGIGAGAVTARFFGAKNYTALKKAIHTTIAFGLICGAVLTLVAEFLAPLILELIGTPEEVMVRSLEYFRFYFFGSIAFVMYNFLMGILQSLGDTRHPLIYLVISSGINIALDLLFIAVLGYGVWSAACATAIAQAISAILCFIKLTKLPEEFRVRVRDIKIDKTMLGLVVRNGVPAGLQNSLISVANVFVQANINAFGAMAVAGSGSYLKIEGFAFVPVICFSQALTTFIGQNLGAREYNRAKRGAKFGIICSMGMAEVIGIAVFLLAPFLIRMFGADEASVVIGVKQAHVQSLFFCLLACSHCMAAVQRGAGRSFVPMLVMFGVWCVFRVAYIYTMVGIFHRIEVVFSAYPVTWTISSLIFLIIFLKSDWLHGLEKQRV